MAMRQLGWEASVIERFNGFLYRCKADQAYTMLQMTSGIARVFGYPIDELVGNHVRTFSSLIHSQDLSIVDDAVAKGLSDKANWDINYRLLAADGRSVWVHETGGGIWDDHGQLLYLEGAVADIDILYKRMQDRTAEL